jgi:hypothetical protein
METHEPTTQAIVEHKRETLGEEDHKSVAEAGEGADVVAKMAALKVRDIKQPKLTGSRRPEHVLPNAAFTFKRPIWSRDPGVEKTAELPKSQADDAKRLEKIVPELPKDMSPAFKFNLPTHIQRLAFESRIGNGGESDMAAKTAGLPAYIEIHPTKAAPQQPEHVVPTATFTFTSRIRNPQMRPKLGLKQRKGTDLAAKMAKLQVGDVEQPPKKAPEHPGYVMSNAAITLTSAIDEPQPIPIFGFKQRKSVDVAATHRTDAQGAATKTLPVRQQFGLPTAAFTFANSSRSGGSGLTAGVDSGATSLIDAQQTASTPKPGVFDETDLVTAPQTTPNAHEEARAGKFLSTLFTFAFARVLKKDLSDLIRPIYDLPSPPREAKSLRFLSGEFWQVLDQCREANAASEILETELHGLDQERNERIGKYMDEYMSSIPMDQILERVTREPQESSAEGDVQPIVWPEFTTEGLYEAVRPSMHRVGELEGLIEKARDVCSKHEAKLNDITWDLMVSRGLVPASVVTRTS